MKTLNRSRLFDFGLTEAQEKRAQRLHKESIIIDMLPMGPLGPEAYTKEMAQLLKEDYEKDHDLARSLFASIELPLRMAAQGEFPALKEWWDISGVTACSRPSPVLSLQATIENLGLATLQFDRIDWLIKARSGDDIRRAKAEGKHATYIDAQDTMMVGLDLDNLNMLHDFGLNVLQLTYNSMNYIGAGCTERTDAGVSNFGIKFIERMNELGIMVDTGHCGHQTTLDACDISSKPVIASHTIAKGVYDYDRGKTDEEIEAIAKTGGVIGVTAVPFFLSDAAEVTMEHYLDHIDYIGKLVGYKHVGIGTDWPMSMPEWALKLFVEKTVIMVGFRPEHKITANTVKGFKDYRDFINITRGLVSRGYTDARIKDILGGNWLRVMDAVWK